MADMNESFDESTNAVDRRAGLRDLRLRRRGAGVLLAGLQRRRGLADELQRVADRLAGVVGDRTGATCASAGSCETTAAGWSSCGRELAPARRCRGGCGTRRPGSNRGWPRRARRRPGGRCCSPPSPAPAFSRGTALMIALVAGDIVRPMPRPNTDQLHLDDPLRRRAGWSSAYAAQRERRTAIMPGAGDHARPEARRQLAPTAARRSSPPPATAISATPAASGV